MNMNPIEELFKQKTKALAYQKAQARGFQAGHELEDWHQAAQEIADTHQQQSVSVLINEQPVPQRSQLNEAMQQRIAQTAYGYAEARNFEPDHELEDWIQAERMIETSMVSDRCYPSVHARIETAAYQRAEERGNAAGFELEDWCAAEREVEAQLEMAEADTSHVTVEQQSQQ